MEKYIVKEGDTLRKLAKRFGKTVEEFASANSIQDPNLIKVGQELVIPGQTFISTQNQKSPVLQNQNIEMSSVPENVPTVPSTREEIQTPEIQQMTEEDFNKLFSQYNQTTETTKATQDPLVARQTQLQNEITALEEEMSRRTAVRNEELDVAGVFADMRKLNELRSELSKAQDRSIEIPLEKRQELRGRGATITELEQATTPELEKAALAELIASRKVESLTDIINTNIAIIDQQLKAINDQKDFIYAQKQKELENVQKIYGDIMTEEQKAKAEEAKYTNQVNLEYEKMRIDLMKEAKTKALESGANPREVINAVNTGDLTKLYSMGGSLDNNASYQTAMSLYNTSNRMLENNTGLESSVGPNFLSRALIPGSNATKFREDAKSLVSKATIENFLKIKASGATFGAMSDSEWEVVTGSSDVAPLGIDAKTGKSKLSNKDFKERLKEYQNVSMKIATAVAMKQAGYDPSILKDESPEVIKAYFDKYVTSPKATQDYASQDVSGVQANSGNLPQRNNNPGNVKSGGLKEVDALSIGTDNQGHLIFPNPQTGFEALVMDVQAKINGNSRWLPANPTISEMGKVYAENSQNWINNVTKELGVSPETRTKTIPITNLVLAIAKAEGFYSKS